MRRAPLLGLLLPLLAVAACEDSSSGSNNGFPEAGTPSLDGGDNPFDAGPQPDAQPSGTGITVTVKARAPLADIRVLFHDAAGAVTGDQKTDAAGKVVAKVAPSQVTILLPSETTATPMRLVTYVGVAEGDALVVDTRLLSGEGAGSYTAALPGPISGTDFYALRAGAHCGTTSSTPDSLTFEMGELCGGAASGVLGAALDVTSRPLAFAYAKSVPLPAVGATTTVSLGPWATPGSFLVTASNLPAGSRTRAAYTSIVGETGIPMDYEPTGTLAAGGLSFFAATGFADSNQATAIAEFDEETDTFASVAITRREPASTSTAAFDFAQALPRLTTGSATLPTPKRPELQWTSAAPLTGADGGYAAAYWSVRLNSDESQPYVWLFVVPPSAVSVRAPELPADAASFTPPASDAGLVLDGIAFIDVDVIPGYAQLKALPTSAPAHTTSFLSTSTPLPANMTARISAFRKQLE